MAEPVAPPSPSSRFSGRLTLRTRIILIVFATTALATAVGAYLTVRFFDARLTEAALQSTEQDLEELRVVLQADMVASHEGSLTALVSQIARGPGVAWVGIADNRATVRVSSDRGQLAGGTFLEGSPERDHLDRWERSRTARSYAYISGSCNVLRVMAPIENTTGCWRCHDPARATLGMLVIDRSLTPLKKTVAVGTRWIAVGGVGALALILLCVGFVVERAVLTRLGRLRHVAHRLGGGDLSARAHDRGGDELGDVAREFDRMASRLETAMEGLTAQRGQLEQLVNGIADGVLLLDLDARVIAVNHAFRARFTSGEEPSPGVPYRQLLLAAGIGAEQGTLPAELALASGKLEKAVVPVRGERFEELYAQPLLGPDGRATGVIEVWRDITERKVLEASVEQSERLASLGVLASSVAHEVGNPLASIVTAVDGLLARLPEHPGELQPEIREYLELVRRQVFRCHGATQRLLGFARVPSAGQDRVIDVAAAAREVATLIGPQAAKQGVAVEVVAPAPALSLAPEGAIEQVFLNLTLNALNAMSSGGTLRVEVRVRDGAVDAIVADTGAGIPELVSKHLFQPFRTSRRDGRGTGLGLFISQALVQRAGGSIEVESALGRGTTFRVRLLQAEVGLRPAPEARPEATP